MSRKERSLYDEHEVRHLLVEMLGHYDFDIHESHVLLPKSSFSISQLLVECKGEYFVFDPAYLNKPHYKWEHVRSMIVDTINGVRRRSIRYI